MCASAFSERGLGPKRRVAIDPPQMIGLIAIRPMDDFALEPANLAIDMVLQGEDTVVVSAG